ncbi:MULTISPECIES: c-type cytochrome [Pantoea]|jgi:mono/diheme cytochrome c family protein|uniref:Cytochrome c n=1 Tax=Pantoea brenneri TaxID=472694 RepID=A0A7Y6NFK4_9GAMM|nr:MULTISPECIES: cytochrome c [Pantoea]MBZ6396447.1 cytochrome c [Pantoea sp.]MBZ6439864.1 cytochrome c [Pantoea sp.]MCQ5471546.1 cytochrome c [Pantoea brenneri]MDU4748229.1 cytochrome c [Pantoea sp.]NUY42609.1 cytochrome c [Pantoea brenneri]
MKHKKLSLTLLAAVVVAGAAALWLFNTPDSPFDRVSSAASASSADLIQRGEYVARLSDCVACHSTAGSAPFSGGLAMATPVGKIYTTNITPDDDSGIGRYSLADFDRAVRHGVARDGHRLYPAMPFPSYQKLSDQDIAALYAFMMHGVKPASRSNTPSEIPWPLNMRWPLALWRAAFAAGEPWRENDEQNAAWNRGAYLVEGPGHCGSCHTPRGLAFNEKALDASSPDYLAGALLDGWYAPSLRNDANSGFSRWSEEDVVTFLKTGRNQHGVVFGSMTDAFNNSTQFMHDSDLRAIAHYLKSLPPGSNNAGPRWQYPTQTSQPQLSDHPGSQIYTARCSSCHGADGRGQAPWIPPLAGATSLQVDPASAINVVLNGSARVVSQGIPDAYRMPPYRKQLSDRQTADVLNFIRSAWGNQGEKTDAGAVKAMREKTDPASSEVIILQMR